MLQVQLRHQQQLQIQEQQPASDTEEAAAPEAPAPTADEVREELLPLLLNALQQSRDGAQPGHLLMAITMLCMLPGYEARAVDLLQPLFHEFQGKVRNIPVILSKLHSSLFQQHRTQERHAVARKEGVELCHYKA